MSKRLLGLVVATAALSLALVASASAAVVAGNTGWYWSNPLPQGNSLTLADTIAGRAYVAGEAGTLMRSDNGGATWTGIRSGLPAGNSDLQNVRAVTPDVVVFASSCGLRRTDDGGVTVRRLPWGSDDVTCPATISSLSFPNGSVGYLLLSNGDVVQTLDGGDSWRKQTAAPGSQATGGGAAVADIWFPTATSGVLSVGGQIYYSSDSGSSWTPAQAVNGSGMAHFEFISPTVGFAVGSRTSLYKTTDGGVSWAPVAGDGTVEGNVVGSLSCTDATTCLAATADGVNLLRTTDGGTSWTTIKASTRPVFAVGFTTATHAIAVGAQSVIVKTDDAGSNWSAINSEAAGSFTKSHVDNGSSAVLFGGGTSLARTTDAGASWKPITTLASGTIVDAAFPTATRGYVLDSQNSLRRSDDGGIAWKVLDLQGAKPRALYAPSEKTLLLVGGKGVRRSQDAGLSFNAVGKSKFRKRKFGAVDRAGSAVMVYGETSLAVSKNDGRDWKLIALPKKVKTVYLADFADAKTGWIVDSNAELWQTSNAGKKWVRNETNGMGPMTSMALTDTRHGMLADGSGSIFVTTDAGRTWSQQSPFLSKKPIKTTIAPLSARGAVLFVPSTNRILATSTFGQIGPPSKLTIKASAPKIKKGKTVQVTGKLAPSQGGELVTVLARPIDAKSGTNWKRQTALVSLGGTFTTTWKLDKPMIFVARWAGDATHDGDGADAVFVKLKK
jgi:photosystem II stability/assembly factor-like uncharacterized protein